MREGEESWKKCKLVGSLIDTTQDINRRKGLALSANNKLKSIMNSKKVSTRLKVKALDSYIKSIFLYNSEIWTATKKVENSVDVFQRILLRRILKVTWRDKVSNRELYEKTRTKPWSIDVTRRRLNWLGHLLRLPETTPVRKAFNEALRVVKRPVGKPKSTWVGLVAKELSAIDITLNAKSLDEIIKLADNREAWRRIVGRAMSI